MPSDRIAEYWRADADVIECCLCPHHCRLRDGQWGRCRVRRVLDGRLIAASYGCLTSAQLDPIEKKPLYHFYPGSMIFSLGGWGCNFACDFCQNWSISQAFDDPDETAAPEAVWAAVQRSRARSVAYTYNEPLVNYEFVYDCSRLMHAHEIDNVLVTNGFVEVAPAEALLTLTDAVNLDIKSMHDAFYRDRCRGRLDPVLRFARQARAAGCHLEITHLMVDDGESAVDGVERLSAWIAEHLGAETPLHLSAYHPQYRSNTPATQTDRLLAAHAEASKRLPFVYLGNVRLAVGRDTHCPQCRALWVRRGQGYAGAELHELADGCCAGCGAAAPIRIR